MHRDERTRARGLHRERRPAQIQLVRHARGDVVLVVAHQRLQALDLRDFGDPQRRLARIRAHARRAEHTGAVRHAARRMAGVLQRVPDDLQEEALLRIDRFGFLARVAEQRGVERIGIAHDGADVDEVRRVDGRGVEAGVEQFLPREAPAARLAGEQVVPERVAVVRFGKTAGVADHGNRFAVGVMRREQRVEVRGRRRGGRGFIHGRFRERVRGRWAKTHAPGTRPGTRQAGGTAGSRATG